MFYLFVVLQSYLYHIYPLIFINMKELSETFLSQKLISLNLQLGLHKYIMTRFTSMILIFLITVKRMYQLLGIAMRVIGIIFLRNLIMQILLIYHIIKPQIMFYMIELERLIIYFQLIMEISIFLIHLSLKWLKRNFFVLEVKGCLLYTSPSPRDS